MTEICIFYYSIISFSKLTYPNKVSPNFPLNLLIQPNIKDGKEAYFCRLKLHRCADSYIKTISPTTYLTNYESNLNQLNVKLQSKKLQSVSALSSLAASIKSLNNANSDLQYGFLSLKTLLFVFTVKTLGIVG